MAWSAVAQLGARRDPELRIHAVQVRADGAVREVELLADLAVREPLARHLRDLQLLRRQLVARVGRAAAAALARRPQLLPRALAPRDDAERVERVAGGAQRRPRLRDPAVAAQPRAERELQPRAGERPAREVGVERRRVQGRRPRAARRAARAHAASPPGSAAPGVSSAAGSSSRSSTRAASASPGVDRGLGEVADRPQALHVVVGGVAAVEHAPQLVVRVGVVAGPERGHARARAARRRARRSRARAARRGRPRRPAPRRTSASPRRPASAAWPARARAFHSGCEVSTASRPPSSRSGIDACQFPRWRPLHARRISAWASRPRRPSARRPVTAAPRKPAASSWWPTAVAAMP